MKTVLFLIISLSFALGNLSCNQSTAGEQKRGNQNESADLNSENKIEVYYFHFTRRCATCVAVQEATEQFLKENYPDDMDNGSLVYHEVNLSEPESRDVAQKLDVSGQALLVVSGDEKHDLTMQGFMYAMRDYDRFAGVMKEAITKIKS